MKETDLITRLEGISPGFATYAHSAQHDYSIDSIHGVFCSYTEYVREYPPDNWAAVASFVNSIVDASESQLSNAACTCFLENIAEPNHPIECHLAGFAKSFWEAWA